MNTSIEKHIGKRIEELIEKINDNYTYEKCLLIVGDPDNIPDSLCALLIPTKNSSKELAVWNLDYYHRMYKHGKIDAYEFLCKVETLFDELVREFDELVELFLIGGIEGKEK